MASGLWIAPLLFTSTCLFACPSEFTCRRGSDLCRREEVLPRGYDLRSAQHHLYRSHLTAWQPAPGTWIASPARYCMPLHETLQLATLPCLGCPVLQANANASPLGGRVKDAQPSSDVKTAVQLPDIDRQPAHHPSRSIGHGQAVLDQWQPQRHCAIFETCARLCRCPVRHSVSLHAGNHAAKTFAQDVLYGMHGSKKGTRTTDVTDPALPERGARLDCLYQKGTGSPQ